MKFPSLLKSSRGTRIGAFVFISANRLWACGPDFPNRYLATTEQAMLAAPEGFFAVEIERLAPSPPRACSRKETTEDTREADDLRAALIQRGDTGAHLPEIVCAYQAYRTQQREWVKDKSTCKPGALPDDLPGEFAHYLAGTEAWYEGDFKTAQIEWQAILALPEAERRYRSTWAAYMLGRSAEGRCSGADAQRYFAQTRDLVRRGFADSINLAGAADGVEARWALDAQDYVRAINLYLDQYATGDESAYASLRMVAAAAAHADDRKKCAVARDDRAQRVLTAWFLARFSSGDELESDPRPLRAWTKVLAHHRVRDVDHADRLAWLAYEAGDFELARIWADLAAEKSGETHWIRAKLAMRDNRLVDGAKELGVAAASVELVPIYRSTVLGELGRVQLALDHREAALTACLDGNHWEDAAYVGERLLTIDELKMFLANYRPAEQESYEPFYGEVITPESLVAPSVDKGDRWDSAGLPLRVRLSELLARRLVRAGRIAEAKVYFSEKGRSVLARYATTVQDGFDSRLRPRKRADSFWRAAQLVREEGMALMGTELEPDFGIWDGSFSYDEMEGRNDPPQGLFSITEEEKARRSNIPVPIKRFSYRYRAAELAWWAASLLPNDDDETARILTTAGGWLKSRDPLEANRFYQALVIRCGRTKLGKAAADTRWFPTDL